MSIRYTLRLVENGAEVWSRYSGDREEMLRTLAKALPDLDIYDWRALEMANNVKAFNVEALEPGEGAGFRCYTKDLGAHVELHIYRTKPKE